MNWLSICCIYRFTSSQYQAYLPLWNFLKDTSSPVLRVRNIRKIWIHMDILIMYMVNMDLVNMDLVNMELLITIEVDAIKA